MKNKKDKEKKSNLGGIIASSILVLSVILYGIVAVSILKNNSNRAETYILGHKPLVVVSGSMEPSIMTNSIVVVKQAPETGYDLDTVDLKDEVILFKMGDNYVIHRVVDIDENGILTKGDNNNVDDGYIEDLGEIKGTVILTMNWIVPIVSVITVITKGFMSAPLPQKIIVGLIVLVSLVAVIKLIKYYKKPEEVELEDRNTIKTGRQ